VKISNFLKDYISSSGTPKVNKMECQVIQTPLETGKPQGQHLLM